MASTPKTTADVSSPDRQRDPLARGFEIIALMVESGESSYGVRELGTYLGVSPSTAHRLLTDLEKLGMVRRSPDGSYQLGLEFLRLSWKLVSRFPLREMANDLLQEMTDKSGESSFLGIYNDQRHEMMFAVTVDSPHPLRYMIPLQKWLPLHSGASGLSILAFLPEETRREILQGNLTKVTENTIVDPAILSDRIEAIRRNGYAVSLGERVTGAIALAAPVFGPGQEVVGTSGLMIPESRFDARVETELSNLVKHSAAVLSERMGGTLSRS
ncbi:IclR family transcriptional regulator [Paenarthrobacter sp. NPDC058040]|uniref:IclR family transcriptional regulator n=1 Tax=unclassified Paenarthrobacter TaxID=2634190 RepID=UPI0036DCB969